MIRGRKGGRKERMLCVGLGGEAVGEGGKGAEGGAGGAQ